MVVSAFEHAACAVIAVLGALLRIAGVGDGDGNGGGGVHGVLLGVGYLLRMLRIAPAVWW